MSQLLPRLVTLDITGTVLRVSQGGLGFHYGKIAALHNVAVSQDLVSAAFLEEFRRASEPGTPPYGGVTPEAHRAWWSNVAAACLMKGLPESGAPDETLKAISHQLYDHFRTADAWETTSPGVKDTLAEIRAAGGPGPLCLGVLSNFDERLEDILKSCGLESQFDFVLTSGLTGLSKPAEEIFRAALAQGQAILARRDPAMTEPLTPGQCTHVGDDATKDVAGYLLAAHALALLKARGPSFPPLPPLRWCH
ncbi:hypothetical protein, variant [Fonticula alba]|uniref:Haloacid dehalogenase-like hydrolase domain-containing protein 3 n=1 Tax=Fonticula alba TaxID=691883 RepID=A0A058Z680_FONAL|nr:hypothetical protein, variant [Fonticula alba]KCV69428.1 hypothetical protein, variant [Fonticula alba]|eukprot:XP_009495993.1 hypothetical protein, variant [Fonticula alba]